MTAWDTAARFQLPMGLAIDSADNLYVADQGGDTIRKITPGALVTTLAGKGKVSGTNDGVGGNARFTGPEGVAVDRAGNVYVSDSGNDMVRKITPGGVVTTLAGNPNRKRHRRRHEQHRAIQHAAWHHGG